MLEIYNLGWKESQCNSFCGCVQSADVTKSKFPNFLIWGFCWIESVKLFEDWNILNFFPLTWDVFFFKQDNIQHVYFSV